MGLGGMAGTWRESVWHLPHLEVSTHFQDLEGARRLRNGHVAGETGLQNPEAERRLGVRLAQSPRTRPVSPGRGAQLRFSNNDDDDGASES